MAFVWDEDKELFIDPDSGEEMSLEEAEDMVDEIIEDAFEDADTIIDEFIGDDGKNPKDPDRWHAAIILLLKDTFLILAALGIGGLPFLDEGLRSQMQNALDRQLGYLMDFASQVALGRLSIRAIKQRSKMYVNSSRSSYWMTRSEFERRRGMMQSKWVSRGDSHVCLPCTEAEDMGWRSLGTFGQPGSGIVTLHPLTLCLGLTSCRCIKEYR
jgi:hypothetical protein